MTRELRQHVVGLVALALAGCGGLESPDLARGAVAGRVVGASQTGYAYPLGHPEQRVTVAADGSFELSGVAAGPVEVVVYDDLLPDGGRRAALVTLQVPGAGRARFTVNGEAAPVDPAAKMALAGRVVATAVPDGGGQAVGSRFVVEGTDLDATTAPGATAVTLGLLPAAVGRFRLTASVPGYLAATRTIDVDPATNAYDLRVEIEAGGTGPKGCAAAPAGEQCLNGLVCDPATGRCDQCLADADCSSGTSCDPGTHVCTAPSWGTPDFGTGAICEACTRDDQCAGAMVAPRRCELAAGATTGFCTVAPFFASYCPAGMRLLPDPDGFDRCVPSTGCADYLSAFGRGCFSDASCNEGGALAGAVCTGADPANGRAGTCTAYCRPNHPIPAVACPVAGFTCHPSLSTCVRP